MISQSWFQCLRNCFITVAECGLLLPLSLTKRLVNHNRPSDVTEPAIATARYRSIRPRAAGTVPAGQPLCLPMSASVTPHVKPVRLAPWTMAVVAGNVMRVCPIRVRTTPRPAPANAPNGPIFGMPGLGRSMQAASMPADDDRSAAADCRFSGDRKLARPFTAKRGRSSTRTSSRAAGVTSPSLASAPRAALHKPNVERQEAVQEGGLAPPDVERNLRPPIFHQPEPAERIEDVPREHLGRRIPVRRRGGPAAGIQEDVVMTHASEPRRPWYPKVWAKSNLGRRPPSRWPARHWHRAPEPGLRNPSWSDPLKVVQIC